MQFEIHAILFMDCPCVDYEIVFKKHSGTKIESSRLSYHLQTAGHDLTARQSAPILSNPA